MNKQGMLETAAVKQSNMIIDRHNYETYFLLYADRELDASTAAAVEAFAAAHPDLQEELDLLLQTRLTGTQQLNNSFKASLLREIPETESLETLLLYLDKELNAEAAQQAEQFIRSNAAAQQQWALLQKTRLQPDAAIQFPNKETLYRHETPLHTLWQPWAKRMAAAAAVAALVLTAWWLVQPGATTQNNMANTKTNVPATAPLNSTTAPDAIAATPGLAKIPGNNEAVNTIIKETNTPLVKTFEANNIPAENNTAGNNLPVLAQTTLQEPQEIAETFIAAANSEKKSATSSNITPTSNVPTAAGTANAEIAYYNGNNAEAVVDDADADTGLLSDELQRRSGLTGFLKKARRTIERRTGIATGEGQLRFAVFAVNTQ